MDKEHKILTLQEKHHQCQARTHDLRVKMSRLEQELRQVEAEYECALKLQREAKHEVLLAKFELQELAKRCLIESRR